MKERFKELSEKYPNLSSAMVYSKLIKDKKLKVEEIRKWFNKFVNKDDWTGTPKEELISFFHKLSNGLK